MAFFTETVNEAASKLGKWGVVFIVKQFKYLIQHKKIIANMEGELGRLKAQKQTLQKWVDTQNERGYEFQPSVQDWLSRVTFIENELQNKGEVKKNKKCFGGQCPNLVGNYSLGKRATEKTKEITDLNREGRQLPLTPFPKAVPALGSTVIEDNKNLESRNKIIAEVIEKLKDNKFKRISICGMGGGGVGKTTLVKELIKTVKKTKLFDKVVMVEVSQNPDYKKIQSQIVDDLGLELKMQSMEERGQEIVERLKEMDDKKVKVLIVLDDVWNELNFEWIGLPSRDHQKDIKILFTSRYEKECRNMGSQENFPVSVLSEEIKSLESRSKIKAELIEKLKDDNFKRISICGMPGVGKTTLVKELINTKLFDNVGMATVSQNPDYEKIQRQIADGLGLELKSQSMEGRGREIVVRLKNIKVLIVLDDVWDELNFEWIGLPTRDHQKDIKIIFTSRDEKVCEMMGSQKNFQVSVMSENEAWELFQEMAGDVVDKPDINPIAKKIAKECGGLPLAIVTVGRALTNEGKSAWEVALQQLSNPQSLSFSNMQDYVYSRIELSINFLSSEEHKSCLFLCGLFPEDFDIPIESLLRHGVGLGLFEAVDAVWEVRKRINYLVNNLKRCFLLLDSEKPGCVKIHDVVRDVVLKISSKEEHGIFVQSDADLKRLKKKHGKWRRMSLILDEKIELEYGLECPSLELLQVQSQSKEEDLISWPENFICGMSKLTVLVMQNLCIPKPSSLLHALVNLHTLQLEGCDVGDISVIGNEFNKLETLSFAKSNIKELPVELGQLQSLRLLDLTECDHLNFISTDVLAKLSRLEELYFRVKNFPWLLNKDALKKLGNLSQNLKVLEIKVRAVDILPNDLIFKNLEKFWVYVVPYAPDKRREYLESNMIQLRAVDFNSVKSNLMTMQLIKKCEILTLEKVKNLKNVIYELDDSGLKYIKDLRLDSCPNLECVIDWCTPCCAFPLIKSMSLQNLDELQEILHASNHHVIKKSSIEFSDLEKLELVSLPNFIGFSNAIDLNESHQPIHHGSSSAAKFIDSTNKEDGEISSRSHLEPIGGRPSSTNAKLFSSNWMKQFPKLETILLEDCISLEMVFDLEGCSEPIGHALDFMFPQLRKIEISFLGKLSYVWGNVQDRVEGFRNLRFLTISNCDSLKYVFTPAIVRAITNLEELKVSSCELIENIVYWSRNDEEGGNSVHVTNIEFKKLYYLSLSGLPKLVHICSDSLEFECPTLKKFEIDDCPMVDISLLPTHMDAKPDIEVTHSANTKDNGLHSFNENNSRSSTWPHGCTPFLPKVICKGNTDKRNIKEVSPTPTQDHVPSDFELKSRKEKGHMPTLEDLYVIQCNSLDELFYLEEKSSFSVPSHLKTIKIEECDKLRSIVARRGEKKDMISFFTQVKSLHLEKLPNLMWLCFSGTYEPWVKLEDMDEREGDHQRIRRHLFMDESLFPNLTYLVIKACNKINILFSHSSLSSLRHLEKLEVSLCKNMEEIISQEETEASANEITFPKLQLLFLEGLPNLKAFCQGSNSFSFPLLQTAKIGDCPNIKVFSRGFSNTPKLEGVTMNSSSYIQRKDMNAIVQGFKALVASQGFEMLNWTMIHNKGYFIKNSRTTIEAFDKLSVLVPLNEIQTLQHVKKLAVKNCDSLVEVFESGRGKEGAEKGDAIATTHYQLEEMELKNLPKLSHIWKYNIAEVVRFQKLSSIYISNCHNLRSLLSHSMARSLVQLQSLRVAHCDMMEEIVTKENYDTEGGNKTKILFPKLETLYLYDLPVLEFFSSGDYDYDIPLCNVGEDTEINHNNHNDDKVQISFPQLNYLEILWVPNLKCFCSGAYDYNIMLSSIEECPNIATFPRGNVIVSTPKLDKLAWGSSLRDARTLGDLNLTIHYIQNSEKYKDELRKLETLRGIEQDERLVGYIKTETELDIERCHKLLNCIPSNTVHLFSHVEGLRVRECECLREIFESNDCEGGSKMDYELQTMELVSLPKLKHIWKNYGQLLGLQNLEELTIRQCHDLRYVFLDVSMATSLPNLRWLDVSECNKMEGIIRNQEQQQAKIIFSSLRYIELNNLPSLKCFCRSSFPCYVELPECGWITIEDCPDMKTFWDNGTLYTPWLSTLTVENIEFDVDEEVNEAVIRHHNKLVSRHVSV